MHAVAFEGVDAGERRPLRHEATRARRNDHYRSNEVRARICGELPAAVAQTLEPARHLVEMESRFERFDLTQKPVGKLLTAHHRKAGNVVDRLLGIKFRALTARAVENVYDFRLQIEKAEFEHGEQADRPRAKNRNVRFKCHSENCFSL